MSDYARAIDSEQWRSAMLVIVVLGVDGFDDGLELDREFRIRSKHFLRDCGEQTLGEPFGHLQDGVADEAVGDDDVCLAVEEIAPFYEPEVVQFTMCRDEVSSLTDQVGALAFFGADVHQRDAGGVEPERHFGKLT